GIEITGNTVANNNLGIFLNDNWNVTVRNNTLFNNGGSTANAGNILLNNYHTDATSYGIRVAQNILLLKSPTHKMFHVSFKNNTLPATITFDSNYYSNPMSMVNPFFTNFNNVYSTRSFQNWKSFSGQDVNSTL